MNVACSGASRILLTRSFKAAAETRAPPGMGTSPIMAGTRCMASLGPMLSIVAASRVSRPFSSMRRLRVRALATITSSLRNWWPSRVRTMSSGMVSAGRSSIEMMRLPAKTAMPGWSLSLSRMRIAAMDTSNARVEFNV